LTNGVSNISTNLIAKKRALSAVQDIDNPVGNEE
jgi:hypothetical protein